MKATLFITAITLLLALPLEAASVTGKVDCNGSCESTIVYLEGGPPSVADGKTVLFDQKNKVFLPHVLPIQQGTTVEIANGDPFLHNVHVYKDKETILNLALPFQGQVMPHKFDEVGTYEVTCDAHPEMSAFIVVLDNARFAATGEDGSYEIADVAPGEYTLVVWELDKDRVEKSSIQVQ